MARLAFGISGKARAARPSISSHPAFATIVATWFAALLGLVSLILPVELLEYLLMLGGVTTLFPAAGPPLGPIAIGSVALMAAVAGGLAGRAIARRVMRLDRQTALREAPRPASTPPRPINVREELGLESLGTDPERPAAPPRATTVSGDDPSIDRCDRRDRGPERGGRPDAWSGATQHPPAELAQLVDRLASSLEIRRGRIAPRRPVTPGHVRTGAAAGCPPTRAETDAALRAALARLQQVQVDR